jgi:hypothetical protein
MSLILAGILIVGGLVGAIAVAVAVPALFGLIAYDLVDSRNTVPVAVRDTRLRIATERWIARGFVLGGGAFWSIASFAGLFSFRQTGVGYALLTALLPLAACALTLIIGWYYERITAAVLMLASFAVVAYGVIYQFELGVWVIMGFFLIGPMMTSSALFWMARRDQEAFELALRLNPELATVRAEA